MRNSRRSASACRGDPGGDGELSSRDETGLRESNSSEPIEAAHPEAESAAEDTVEPLRELTFGRTVAAKTRTGNCFDTGSLGEGCIDDLAELEARCRWKGEAARWAVERLLRGPEGNVRYEADAPIESKIVEWADKFTDCYYWAKASESSEQADLSLLEKTAGCFESLAEGLASARTASSETRA